MALRPAWKGYLKLSLVTCAVELSNATSESEKIRLRMLNRKTGNTLKRQFVDSASGKPVEPDDQVKGYETGDNGFLLVEESEIDAVQIEASHSLNIESFVDKASIEQIYLDSPYYLAPGDDVSSEAFAVIREALRVKKMAGLSTIVLYRREHPVVIEPLGNGMLLTTLRYSRTVRPAETAFRDIAKVKLDPEMVKLAAHIIEQKIGRFDPEKFHDRYEDALAALIKAKEAGRAPPVVQPASPSHNVVNLFDALKRSLAGSSKSDDGKGDDGKERGKSQKASPAARKDIDARTASKKRKSA